VRERNEDSILTDPSGVLWAIADGMGGYGNGDVASDIVIDCLSRLPDDVLAAPALRARLEEANITIRRRAVEERRFGMGATVVAMMIQNAVANIAWAGDCRAYLLRRGSLRLLTHDHTVVQDLVDQGLLSPEDRRDHPEGNVVTRAVGGDDELDVETLGVPLVAGDRILLCSDGLTACLGDHEIAAAMERAQSPDAMCAGLVQATLRAGAPDNVSVISIFAVEA
jgi:protein phosphatase